MAKNKMTVEEFRKLPKKKGSDPAGEFQKQLEKHNIEYVREFMFIPGKRSRADFLLLHHMVLVEIDGGIWSKNSLGHNRGSGILREMIKNNEAQLLGYKVFRFDSTQIKDGTAMNVVFRALGIGTHKGLKPGKSR